MSFPKRVVEDALLACGRCCCLCHKFCGVRIEMHHLKPKQKGGDDSFENCIPLCFDCHATVGHYNQDHPRGRKFSPSELRRHRDNWYRKVKESNTPMLSSDVPEKTIQMVEGNSNIVAGRDLNVHTDRIIKKTIVQTDPGGKHISNYTARKIKELVDEYINMHSDAGCDSRGAAGRIWSRLKIKFNVTTYKEISLDDSDDVIRWLYAQINMTRPKLRKTNSEKWRISLYKPIYARARELGISKEGLYILAQNRLSLKRPIVSLKELTQKNLEKLHRIMIYEVKRS